LSFGEKASPHRYGDAPSNLARAHIINDVSKAGPLALEMKPIA
jgi:hypothetical protein